MPNEFDTFVKVITKTNSDDVILHAAEKTYAKEISTVENGAVNVADKIVTKVKNIGKKKVPNSVATLTNEKIEENIKNTTPDATTTAMRPTFDVVEKSSKFFKSMDYSVSLDGVEAQKSLTKDAKIGANVDVFDKMVGASYEKKYNKSVSLKTGLQYQPFNASGKLYANYKTSDSNVYGNIYLNESNPGVNAGYSKKISHKSSVETSVSVFKNDAAFSASYSKNFKDSTNLSLGAYGSTRNKEIGVTARIGF